jgi:hypothetical protein
VASSGAIGRSAAVLDTRIHLPLGDVFGMMPPMPLPTVQVMRVVVVMAMMAVVVRVRPVVHDGCLVHNDRIDRLINDNRFGINRRAEMYAYPHLAGICRRRRCHDKRPGGKRSGD